MGPNFEPSLAGKRGLVLDDEFLIALDIQQILEGAGAASVTCCSSAEDAMKALQAGVKFDFAVLDVLLSGATRSSVTIAQALAEQSIPFVFLTGLQASDSNTKAFPNAPVLEKPYDAALLVDALLRALGTR